MNQTADAVGLDLLQLHGNEPSDIVPQLNRPAIRVMHVIPNKTTAEECIQRCQHIGPLTPLTAAMSSNAPRSALEPAHLSLTAHSCGSCQCLSARLSLSPSVCVCVLVDVAAVLLDTKLSGGTSGGTGVTFDWSIAAAVSGRFPVLLAGGLTPSNVHSAVAAIHPLGVDVSSGVERDDGSVDKDVEKVRAFVREAKRQH